MIKLQGIKGHWVGSQAGNAKIGDYRAFNFGSISKIIDIKDKGSKSILMTTIDKDGTEWEKILRKTREIVLCDENGNEIER